jgi:hypothetical protein
MKKIALVTGSYSVTSPHLPLLSLACRRGSALRRDRRAPCARPRGICACCLPLRDPLTPRRGCPCDAAERRSAPHTHTYQSLTYHIHTRTSHSHTHTYQSLTYTHVSVTHIHTRISHSHTYTYQSLTYTHVPVTHIHTRTSHSHTHTYQSLTLPYRGYI